MKKQSELNNYLDDLLLDSTDASEQPEHEIDEQPVAVKQAIQPDTVDYNIYTFPSVIPEYQPHEQLELPSPLASNRYNIERMERLLDDFRQRQLQEDLSQEQSLNSDVEQEPNPTSLNQHIYSGDNTLAPVYKDGMLQPPWAESDFEVVIVEVAGLRIAIPVFSLGAIYSLADSEFDSSKKPMLSTLFIGTAEVNHMHYTLIDSCRWLMPEHYEHLAATEIEYAFYLTHTKSQYAFAVNAVHTSQTLNKKDIKWRKADSKRPWLAGMLKEQKAILVELDVLMQNITETIA